jgi:hypothetical protein
VFFAPLHTPHFEQLHQMPLFAYLAALASINANRRRHAKFGRRLLFLMLDVNGDMSGPWSCRCIR